MSLFDKIYDILESSSEEEQKNDITISNPIENNDSDFEVKFKKSHSMSTVLNRKEILVMGELELAQGFKTKVNKEPQEQLSFEAYPNRKREEVLLNGNLSANSETKVTDETLAVDVIIVIILGDTNIGEFKIGNGSKTITHNELTIEISDVISKEDEPYMGRWGRELIREGVTKEDKEIYIGYSKGGVKNIEAESIPMEEYDKHAYLSGQTGYGKSTILINKAKQFTDYGNNIVVITPKNDDALKIMQTLSDDQLEKTDYMRVGDVESKNVVSYNIFDLSDMTQTEKEKFIEDKVETFVAMMTSKFGSGGIIGPVSESIGKAMMMSEKQYTMADFVKVILDDDKRDDFVEEVKEELDRPPAYLDTLKSFDSDDELDSISRRIKDFEEKEALRQLSFSQESDISFMDYVTGDRNLIVDFELLGEEEKALVGIMILRELWVATKRRAENLPESQRDLVFTMIDEVQDVITQSNFEESRVRTILQKARAYKLSLITASQSPTQIATEFREELKTNTNVKIPLYNATGTNFYSSAFNSVGGTSVSAKDIGGLAKYQSYLQPNPRKPPVKVENFSTYPPRISEMNARDVRRRLINRAGSERVPNKSLDEITIVGQTDGDNEEEDEEDKIWAVARAIDIAQRFYKYQNDNYIEHETRDKAAYVDGDIIKDVLSVIGYDYGYNDFDQFVENHGYYFETRIDKSGNKKVTQYGLTSEGQKLADRQDSGSSSSGGKSPHRKMLGLVREELAKYGVAVIVPQQEGEMSDGIGYVFRDTGNKAVQKLVSEAEPKKIMIEAESTTAQKQPNQTIHNGAKIMQTGAKAVFLFREPSEAEKNEKRLLDLNGYRKQYRDDEYLLYTLSGRSDYLKQDSVRGNAKYPVRPRNNSSKSTLWVHRTSADPSREYVLKDNEEYEHAHISLDKLANDNWEMEDFPAYYYEQDGEIIVKQDGKVADKYTDLQEMKEEWMPIKKPRIPEYEFADTGMPTQDDITHIVYEYLEGSGGSGEFYVFENGDKLYFDQKDQTTTNTTNTQQDTDKNSFKDYLSDDDEDNDESIKDKLDF